MKKLKYAVLMMALFVPVALLAQEGGPGGRAEVKGMAGTCRLWTSNSITSRKN